MKRIAIDAKARLGPGRRAVVLAGALVVALTTYGMAGRGGSPPPPPPPPGDPGNGGGGGPMMDDEAIGSLPSLIGGGLVFLYPGAPHPGLVPSFYVEGPTALLLDALIDAQGTGHIALHPTDDPERSLAVAYGALHVDVDAALFTSVGVETGIVAGLAQGRVAGGLFLDGRLVRRTEIDPQGRRWVLPVGALYEHGLLKDGASLLTRNARGEREQFELRAQGGLVTLHQMN